MRVPKILTDFSTAKYTDAELNLLALKVSMKMTGNSKFPTPYPAGVSALTDLNTAQADFQASLLVANGDKQQTIVKDQKRKALVKVLQSLAVYVNIVSNGDAAIMAGTGFAISKQPSPVGPLPKPGNFSVIATGIGILELSVDPIDGAGAYHWELQQAGSTQSPIVKSSTASTVVVANLESLKQYACRVVAVGSDKTEENYSDTITASVL